jgi:hypothetical protein
MKQQAENGKKDIRKMKGFLVSFFFSCELNMEKAELSRTAELNFTHRPHYTISSPQIPRM